MDFLDAITEKDLLLMSMMADLADECSGLLRLVDTEQYDLSEFPVECESLIAKLHRLINKGELVSSGFTAYMLNSLEKPRGYLVRGQPKTLGGPGKVTTPLILQCIEQCQAFLVLATNTIKAEFPDSDILTAFRVFAVVKKRGVERDENAHINFRQRALTRIAQVLHLDATSLQQEFEDLEHVALYEQSTSKSNSFDAWKTAVLRVRARPKATKKTGTLFQALCAYGAWNGLASSGVEQNFSVLQEGLVKQRRLMSDDLKNDEMQLLLLPKDVVHADLCKGAQKHWQQYFGAERKSCFDRLDKGKSRASKDCLTVTNVQKKRQLCNGDVEAIHASQVEACAVQGSSGIWSERMAKELTFQKSKQYDNRIEGYLANALLADEVDEELHDAALAAKNVQEKNDRQRQGKEKRIANLLIPQKVQIKRNKFFLEDSSWLNKINAADRRNVMIHPWDAQNWVVSDVSNPQENVLWTASLLGGFVVDLQYCLSDGEKGLALHFSSFLAIERKMFMSEAFQNQYTRLSEVLRHCLRHPSSKVAVLKDWASFAEVHGRTQPGNRMKIIALASDHECARANERNIFSKPNFAAFMCRMAFAKRDLCGL